MNTMNPAKTPAEIAKIFGCTEEHAREHAALGLAQLKKNLEKARASKTGKLRGLTVEWYENRVAAFEAVL
jgi:ABC-type enterochelin transport system substrate-binding protein